MFPWEDPMLSDEEKMALAQEEANRTGEPIVVTLSNQTGVQMLPKKSNVLLYAAGGLLAAVLFGFIKI